MSVIALEQFSQVMEQAESNHYRHPNTMSMVTFIGYNFDKLKKYE